MLTRIGVVGLALLALASVAEGQTGACPSSTALAVNPSGWVCITPNADHDATTNVPAGGTGPTVVRYDLLLFAPGANTATGNANQTIPIGKPVKNAQGALWVQVPAVTQTPPGEDWKARVVAIGQPLTAGGPAQVSPRSPESNPFERALPPPTAPGAPLSISVPGS